MKSSLKKSLYLGLAAVSVLAASGFAATNASAKSYAYVTKADYFTTAPETRNVVPNGSHALYTKVGTSRGTRVVASKTTMGNLANSTNSGKFFRAYSIVTTNRGSVTTRLFHLMAHTVAGSTVVKMRLSSAVGLLLHKQLSQLTYQLPQLATP